METQQVSTRRILEEKEKEGKFDGITFDAAIVIGIYYITTRFTIDT